MCARCWAGSHKKVCVSKGKGGRTVKSLWRSCRKCTNVSSRYPTPPRLEGKGRNSYSVLVRSSSQQRPKGMSHFVADFVRKVVLY